MPKKPDDQCPIKTINLGNNSDEIDEADAYHELVNYALICIHEIDLDGCLQKMNRAGLTMMGLEKESQIQQKPYTSFVGENNQSWITDLLYKAIHGQPIPNFDFSVGVNDEKRSFTSNFIPMLNTQGKVVKVMGVTREITEEVRAKEQLLKLNLELKDRIVEAIKELQGTVDTLTQTQTQLVESKKMEALGSLVAGVAHEINTPLGVSITAGSHLKILTDELKVQFQNDTISRKTLKHFIDESENCALMVNSNLARAAKLVQEFKQIAVDQNSQSLRSYNLNSYIQSILHTLSPKYQSIVPSINLSCPDDLDIYGDPSVLTQILSNLVSNSIAHGFKGMEAGTIKITVLKMGKSVQLIYRDSGCGINKENIDKIYEPFYTTSRGEGSSGLGLNMIYNLVTQALNGSIVCHSQLNKGTQFTIEFPYNYTI